MIVIDTSAIAAIVFKEPERKSFLDAIESSDRTLIASPTALEARLVMHGRKGERGVVLLNELISNPKFEWIAPDREIIDVAHAAFVTYGKGSGHPAGLNFGDLFSYALAKVRGLPLLYKGEDFAKTDIESALQ